VKPSLLGAACTALLINTGTTYGFSFTDLGELPFNTIPRVSGDGGVVFTSTTRWTVAGGWGTWESYTGGAVISGVRAVSSDGSILAGNLGNSGYHWSASTGLVSLGQFPSTYSFSVNDISADGRVVVGTGTDTSDQDSLFPTEGFKWTANTGLVGLGPMTEANAVTSDGSIIAGAAPLFFGPPPQSAAFWTADSSWTTIISNSLGSSADGIADDGTLMVNNAQPRFSAPQLWSPITDFTDLIDDPRFLSPIAWDISSNGSIVVGATGSIFPTPGAWVWDELNGTRSIEELLIAEGFDLTGWADLGLAVSVSNNGSLIVGTGNSTDGTRKAWLMDLAPVSLPPALYLFGTGLLGLAGVARRQSA